MNAPFVLTLEAEPMFPATKRSLPSSWKRVFVMVDVGPPRTRFVELPKAPRYIRLDVESILNQKGAFATVLAPKTRLVVFVFGRTKSFVDEYDQSSEPPDDGQFVPSARQTALLFTVTYWLKMPRVLETANGIVEVVFVAETAREPEERMPPDPTVSPPPTVN